MIKLFLLLFLSGVLLILWTCAAPSAVNHLPAAPSNPYPVDNAMNVPIDVTLSWSCSGPDGDSLTYDFYSGTDSNPPLVKSNHTSDSFNPGTHQYNTTCYWKIAVKDGRGRETEESVWKFTTESESALVDYIYVTGGSEGLLVIDVTNPRNPKIAECFDTAGDACRAYVSEGYTYVADEDNGLVIVNVTDPTNLDIACDMLWITLCDVFGF